MKQINIGLIGVGGMGARHADNLHQRVVGLTVTAVNDSPVNSVPGPQATGEDTPLVFSTANGNPNLVPTGKYVYFSSDADPLSTNPERNREIYRYIVKTGVRIFCCQHRSQKTVGSNSSSTPQATHRRI